MLLEMSPLYKFTSGRGDESLDSVVSVSSALFVSSGSSCADGNATFCLFFGVCDVALVRHASFLFVWKSCVCLTMRHLVVVRAVL